MNEIKCLSQMSLLPSPLSLLIRKKENSGWNRSTEGFTFPSLSTTAHTQSASCFQINLVSALGNLLLLPLCLEPFLYSFS